MPTPRALVLSLVAATAALRPLPAQSAPLADVHFHSLGPTATQSALATLDSLGVGTVVLIGTPALLDAASAPQGMRLIKALTLPCGGGRMPNAGIPCYGGDAEWPSLDSVRAMASAGRLQMLGEINVQYLGLRVDDPALEPYLTLAEELGLPVGFHLGIGPPGVAYEASRFPPAKSPRYSGSAGDPLLLEPVLVRHPRLRVYVMHAAWPFGDAMRYLLYMHPQLYVDVSVLQYAIPRPAYAAYLQSLVDAGFGSRIMFGSDGDPRRVREGITAIRAMPFLSPEQQDAILGGNAARFFDGVGFKAPGGH